MTDRLGDRLTDRAQHALDLIAAFGARRGPAGSAWYAGGHRFYGASIDRLLALQLVEISDTGRAMAITLAGLRWRREHAPRRRRLYPEDAERRLRALERGSSATPAPAARS